MVLPLELRGITRRFDQLVANDDVSLTVRAGSVHALLGENGAGKSTLMKIAVGLVPADRGTVLINGKVMHRHTPRLARRLGMGMVHQHFSLVPTMTVAENMALGDRPWSPSRLPRKEIEDRLAEIAERYGLKVDSRARCGDLPVAVQQRVEIIRAILHDADVLVFDEPTAILAPHEVADLLDTIRGFRDSGKAVLFVSHKLPEVMAIADEMTVLRKGRVVFRSTAAETDADRLIREMVGETAPAAVRHRPPVRDGGTVLEIDRLSVRQSELGSGLSDVEVSVGAGEILGVAAVAGNGQTELIRAVAGLVPTESGAIHLSGKDIAGMTVADRRAAGVAYLPVDRVSEGSAVDRSVEENVLMRLYRDRRYRGRILLRGRDIRRKVEAVVSAYSLSEKDVTARAGRLSGGNLQRVVAAAELAGAPRLLLAEEPTWGLDVRATRFLHDRIRDLRDDGAGVLLASSDLAELIDLSDRIIVLYRGRVAGTFDAAVADPETLGRLMVGAAA
ncbi:ABC transporter ATP-binding protein [Amycolatopsis jejuensis]|uniref:ABC transporter ATP-binding protein n=1 Tax=Amycolatopsis jejuensis TaxID=330084 RepID=UPI000526F7F8|nr:ABC transporter ATP-binding protein [Amycolatopsis jejuensis]